MKRVAEKIRQNISLRKGDMVRVMRGKDRDEFHNKSARVLSVDSVKMKVTVEHAHMINQPTRIGHNRLADGSRVRICRRCGLSVDK